MRQVTRALGAAGLAVLLVAEPLAAQGPAPAARFERWTPASAALAQRRQDPMHWLLGDGSEDHRYPGFYIAGGFGLALGLLALGFCGDTDSNSDGCSPFTYILVPLASTALFGTVGALLGSLIPRSHGPAPAVK